MEGQGKERLGKPTENQWKSMANCRKPMATEGTQRTPKETLRNNYGTPMNDYETRVKIKAKCVN